MILGDRCLSWFKTIREYIGRLVRPSLKSKKGLLIVSYNATHQGSQRVIVWLPILKEIIFFSNDLYIQSESVLLVYLVLPPLTLDRVNWSWNPFSGMVVLFSWPDDCKTEGERKKLTFWFTKIWEESSVNQNIHSTFSLLSCSHLAIYKALSYLKKILTSLSFT